MKEYSLDIGAMIAYAAEWADKRNPDYYDFSGLGGDCTNFISQCVYAGGAVMNYTKDVGWYYISPSDRAAAWTGVEFFYRFMTRNTGVGPFGKVVPNALIRVGDVVQLGGGGRFYHTLLVTDRRFGEPYVSAHTNDVFNAPLSSYRFSALRALRIDMARRY